LKVASWTAAASKIFSPGRVVILRNGVSTNKARSALWTKLTKEHYPGNLAILLRNAPALISGTEKSDSKAFHVLVLLTPDQKSGEDGEFHDRYDLITS
jgi:antiviral helicase SKI2